MNKFKKCRRKPRAIALYDQLAMALERPDARLLRKLFDTSDLGEIHKRRYEQEMLNTQIKLHEEQNKMQRNLEFVEVFIVTFYSFELVERLVTSRTEGSGTYWEQAGLIAPVIGAVLVYWLARRFLFSHKNGDGGGRLAKWERLLARPAQPNDATDEGAVHGRLLTRGIVSLFVICSALSVLAWISRPEPKPPLTPADLAVAAKNANGKLDQVNAKLEFLRKEVTALRPTPPSPPAKPTGGGKK